MKKWIMITTSVMMLLATAACSATQPTEVPGSATPTTPPPTATFPAEPSATQQVSPVKPPHGGPPVTNPVITPSIEANSAVDQVITDYAKLVNLDPADVHLMFYEIVDWPDGCLGVFQEGVMCIQVITPGYRIIVEVNGVTVELHSNITGDHFLVAPSTIGTGGPFK